MSAVVWRLGAGPPRPVVSIRPNTPRIPASNMKLVTSAGALLQLGPDRRFTTRLVAPIGARIDRTGRLNGPLYLLGGGDPLLATRGYAARFLPAGAATPFADLVRPLRRAGIRAVSGPIVADDGLFDHHTMVPGWPAYYADYTQPLSALAVNQDYAGDGRWRDADRPWLAAAQRLRNTLTGLGIRHRGALRHGRTPPGVRSLGVARSAPLARMVREMNLHSDNFIAEMLVKNVGVHALGEGSTAAGTERIRQVLIQRRILTPADRLADGSGLSRDNRLSAASLARVIAAADRDRSWGRALLASLPHGGEGTLIRRLTEADVAPRVQAKTGFINGAASLSGRVISRNGQRYAFAFLMNTDRIGEAQQLQDRVVALLARGAEDTGRTR